MNLLFKIYAGAKKHWFHLSIGMFSVVAITCINLVAPPLIGDLVSMLEKGSDSIDMNVVLRIAIVLLGTYIAKWGFRFLSSYYQHKAAWNYVTDLRLRLYSHIQTLSLGFYKDKQTGQIMSRIVNDTANFEAMIAHAMPDTITSGLTFIGVTVIMLTINWRLTLLTCIPIPFIFVASMIFAKRIRPNFRKAQAKVGELNAILQDNISGIKEIQVFNQQQRESSAVGEVAGQYKNALLRALRMSAAQYPIIELLTSLGTVIVIAFGGYLATQGLLNAGEIVTFLFYLSLFYAPIATLARTIEEYQNTLASAERVFELLDTQPDISDSADATDIGRSQGNVKFENVRFSYTDGIEVLKGIDFEVEKGGTLAIVGLTGAGKSTIISLLTRFYDPISGKITVDGIDTQHIKLESLRNQFSIVLQDIFLFNGTVAENIAYANPTATREEIIAAAQAAFIHDDIMEMPDGYETQIGERGMKLSGGQKQRMSIARAVLRNSPILILDEATASVDVETEYKIQQAIDQITGRCTIITIAHRLSTIRRANNIIVIDDGKVVESGNHEQLMKLDGGKYKNLVEIQAVASRELL